MAANAAAVQKTKQTKPSTGQIKREQHAGVVVRMREIRYPPHMPSRSTMIPCARTTDRIAPQAAENVRRHMRSIKLVISAHTSPPPPPTKRMHWHPHPSQQTSSGVQRLTTTIVSERRCSGSVRHDMSFSHVNGRYFVCPAPAFVPRPRRTQPTCRLPIALAVQTTRACLFIYRMYRARARVLARSNGARI